MREVILAAFTLVLKTKTNFRNVKVQLQLVGASIEGCFTHEL